MTVFLDDDRIRLQGRCPVEDAEPLVALLQGHSAAAVDLSACEGVHAAVVQALLAFHPDIVGTPDDAFIRDMLLPALAHARRSGEA